MKNKIAQLMMLHYEKKLEKLAKIAFGKDVRIMYIDGNVKVKK